jgi:Cu(I)/Ag(I) efflux system membrane fusion protein
VVSQLKKTRQAQQTVPVYASQDGIIASLNVREGMYVEPMREVMALADLASVWLLAEVFESQSAWVKVGQPAEVRLSYHPGRLWEGTVEYIYPSLNPKTRTLKVRLRFDNPDETLKPNMFATVTIYGGAKKDLIIIPREALIRAGAEERVIIAQGEGSYAARTVTAGMESGDQVAIISGLKEGEEVVTSGQFLIDSEASLKASLQRMTQPQVKKMESAQQPQMAAEIFKGKGTVSSLYPGEQKIKINHQPIAALEWPSMNMDFQLKEGLSADDLKIDDEVVFDLKQTADGYVIQSISQQ